MAFSITKPIEEHRIEEITRVNTLAGEKILTKYPQYKQANMTARAIELQSLNLVGNPEWLAIQAAWDWVKTIRTASNEVNVVIQNVTNIAAMRLEVQNFTNLLVTL
jgi:hypothetical protein